MAFFKCIHAHTHKDVVERRQVRRRDDTVTIVDNSVIVNISPGAYGHKNIKVGDVYEINGRLAEKARRNIEYFKEVDEPGSVMIDDKLDPIKNNSNKNKKHAHSR